MRQGQSKLDAHLIREQNLSMVTRTLHKEQVATAARLRELTGLSVVTLTKLLDTLIENGIVLPGEIVKPALGRPAATYRFNSAYRLLLIVSCYKRGGYDYACYSVHDLFGECIERREELIETIHTDEFRIGIELYLERYRNIAIIGISMPSDTIGGRVAAAIRHDPRSLRLASHLELRFGVPVFFETDINAATLGCYNRLQVQDFVSGIVLVPGRAPACGFCYEGELIRGRDGMAGEVRFFPMYNDVGILPTEPEQADELAVRTLRAVMCVLNPAVVAVYTESLKPGIYDRLKKRLGSAAEIAMLPKIEVNDKIRDDIVSGMITLCLQHLDKLGQGAKA
ncbi:MAG: ROK family protein [Candidatus Anaerobiospirillum merdipullorum]|uniref:ROK family protein n=1 Tax=Candidatus Anaerobiospirillum merdipullorum TaxID=2838450 RepID=A0A9E2KN30_9GAMM|nr:ROK family protein [Candidatus Anaerobiospirillum merdipullorum]